MKCGDHPGLKEIGHGSPPFPVIVVYPVRNIAPLLCRGVIFEIIPAGFNAPVGFESRYSGTGISNEVNSFIYSTGIFWAESIESGIFFLPKNTPMRQVLYIIFISSDLG
jgi:hypothetical protein